MARGKGQQTSGGTKKEKKETRQERRARLEAEAAARNIAVPDFSNSTNPCTGPSAWVCDKSLEWWSQQ